jgi:CD63 antigen
MDCSSTVAKYLVFIFNFLFFLAGIALIVIGSLAITNNQDVYQNIIADIPDFTNVAIVFIVVGSIVTVISFFGCCGAIRESACMLNTFAFLLVLIVLAEIAIAIAAFVLRSKLKDSLTDTISTYPATSGQIDWDGLQTKLHCCGVDSASDWTTSLPASCCSDTSGTCTVTSTSLYTKGCYDALGTYYIAIGVVGIVLGLIEIIGIVFACCLSKQVKS